MAIGPATGNYGRDSINAAKKTSKKTPVAAYDKTGQYITGAYIQDGKTYFGSGTPISTGTKVVDNSGKEWEKTKTGGELTGVTYGIDPTSSRGRRDVSGTGLNQSYYDRALEEQQKAVQARIDAAVQANNRYVPQVNQQSDQALQNAYILREQNRVNAPQALSALGYTGGATETALMGIQTGYENTRNQVEKNRRQSLDDIYQNEQQIRATGDATLSEAAASYYDKLIAAQQQAEAQQQAQDNWQAEYDLQAQKYIDAAEQQKWSNWYDEQILKNKYTPSQTTSSTGNGIRTETRTTPTVTATLSQVAQMIGMNRTPEGRRETAQKLINQGYDENLVIQALKGLGLL